jgi:membrane protease YdiL (CAAX protease family)
MFWALLPLIISWYLGDLSWVAFPRVDSLILIPVVYFLTSLIFFFENWFRIKFWKDEALFRSVMSQESTAKERLRELGIQLYSIGLPEEFISRGFLITFLIPITGSIIAALISGISFGIFHLAARNHHDVLKAFTAGLTSLILALTFIFTKSIWIPVAVHILLNQDLLRPLLKLWLEKTFWREVLR